MNRIALVLISALALTACAETSGMTGAQKGALVGAGTGAAAGAVIGSQVKGNRSGHAGTGAIIGALGGAAAGALIGDAMEQKKPAPTAPQGGQLQPVPPPGQPGTPAAGPPPPPTQASVTVPGQYPADPTRGQLVNGTPYRVKVYVDADPTRDPSGRNWEMNPNEVLPMNLDVGPHRIVAIATRETQFGPRTVGRVDRTLQVDVRGSGWELRFHEGDFR